MRLARFKGGGLLGPTSWALAALIVLLGLGTWQMQRKAWKDGLVGAIEARAATPPLPFEKTVALRCDMIDHGLERSCEFRRVRVRGTFDHSGERHIFAGVQGPAGRGTLGYWVFTPFRPAGEDSEEPGKPMRPILVNRGFVPEQLKASTARPESQTAGETEIVTQVRTRQARSWFDGQNDEAKNIYYVRDSRELGYDHGEQAAGALLLRAGWFYLEMVEGAPAGGYPLPMAGHIIISNRHLEYAITWYGLALTLIGVYVAFARGRLKAASA